MTTLFPGSFISSPQGERGKKFFSRFPGGLVGRWMTVGMRLLRKATIGPILLVTWKKDSKHALMKIEREEEQRTVPGTHCKRRVRKTETNFTAGNRWLVNLPQRGLFVQNGGCGTEGRVCYKRSKSWFHGSKNTDCRLAISSYVYHPIVGVAGWFCKPSFRSHSIWKYHSWVWSMVSTAFYLFFVCVSLLFLKSFILSLWKLLIWVAIGAK